MHVPLHQLKLRSNCVIHVKDGRLAFTGSDELAARRWAEYLNLSIDELVERMLTPTERQQKAEILKHT